MSEKLHRAALASLSLALGATLAGCAVGGTGGGSDGDGVTLTMLTGDDDQILRPTEALIEAFEEQNPDVTIEVETQPGGSEGDNLIKTRLATGEMSDLFVYNSGSLFQALSPGKNLAPLSDRPWIEDTLPSFLESTAAGGEQYGTPFGTAFAGGMAYNIDVYERLGLEVPETWEELLANSEAVKAEGITPVMQTYGDTWTSQIVLLADFHNILTEDPDWADEYTAGNRSYTEEPGLGSFEKIAELSEGGLLNEDFASARLDEGLQQVSSGEAAHYPILSLSAGQMAADYPESAEGVGMFPIPGDDPSTLGFTAWMGNSVYIPASTTDEELEAATAFVDFVASPEGCEAQTSALAPTGPYMVESCDLPDDLPRAIQDIVPYFEQEGGTSLALEFLSPIKGPALEQLTVEVGSGIKPAEDAAALYDEDVEKQAQQLGLEGW